MNNIPKTSFLEYSNIFKFFQYVEGEELEHSADQKSGLSKLHLTCPEAKLEPKIFFLGLVTIPHFFFGLWRKHIGKFVQKFCCGFPKLPFTSPMKMSKEVIFFGTFQFLIFFRTLSGKGPAVKSEPVSTCPEEPMKNEVSIQNSLVLKNVFAIWRFFGFILKNFNRVLYAAFCAFRKKVQVFFGSNFCFLMVIGKTFLVFGRSLQRVVNSTFYVPRGRFGGKMFFSK